MSPRTAARLAWSLAGIGVIAVLLDIFLRLITPRESLPELAQTEPIDLLDNLSAIGLPLLGGLVASRRPKNPLGWLFLAAGLGLGLANLGTIYAARGLVAEPGSLPGSLLLGWFSNWCWTLGVGSLPLLTLLFPTGRTHSARWRPFLWISIAAVCLLVGSSIFIATTLWNQPLLEEENWPALANAAVPLVLIGVFATSALSLLGGVSLIFRFRAAKTEERQQLKWFILWASGLVLALALDSITQGPLINWAILLTQLGLYAALAIAILRYRLYDIDRIINRTLTYALLTAGLAAVYFGLVIGLQAALRSISGGSDLAIVVTTLVVAALFLPARRRVQNLVDRRFNRRAYDAAQTVDAFSARLREQIDLDTLRYELLTVVDDTMAPSRVSVWLRPTEAGR
jgi:hypothetical protein